MPSLYRPQHTRYIEDFFQLDCGEIILKRDAKRVLYGLSGEGYIIPFHLEVRFSQVT